MAPATDRQTFRATLGRLAEKTKAKIPALNGRVEKAVRLALAGDVELHENGTATVSTVAQTPPGDMKSSKAPARAVTGSRLPSISANIDSVQDWCDTCGP